MNNEIKSVVYIKDNLYCLNDIVEKLIESKNSKDYIVRIKNKESIDGNYYVTKNVMIDILGKGKSIKAKEYLKYINHQKENKEIVIKDKTIHITTEENRVVIGNNNVTNAYIRVAWTVTSDARDKTNIAPIVHGLDFVKQLNPVSYQFRTSREDETPHGNKRYGFLAQDILALEGDDPVIIDNEQPDHLKYQGEALVPVLVKAIQELKAEFDEYKRTHP